MPEKAEKLSQEELESQKYYMDQVRFLPVRPKTYHIITYGCQMNAHDSENIAGMLNEMGLKEAPSKEEADFVLFNTCCVRDNAERRALGNVQWLHELQKKRSDLMIGVCGCMIQQKGMPEKILKQYRFINLAFGTTNLYRFPELFYRAVTGNQVVIEVSEKDRIVEGLPVNRLRKDAAYISIMQGCNHFCTYCIVPYVRGRERSRDMQSILKEAEELAKNGTKEVMLLGQNVNSYGKGTAGVTFPELLRQLDQVGIERIRFMTSHPKDLSDELIEVMGNSKHVLPQFHLPVQSGSNEVLRRMNRGYTRETYLKQVESLRRAVPGIGLSTDIIVAFPGETDAQFRETLELVDEVGFDSAFTFIFSPRAGTKAAEMDDQIPESIASERIQKLIALQEMRQKQEMQRFIGQTEEVLVESISRRCEREVSGRGRHGLSITFPGSETDIGEIRTVHITEIKNNTLYGHV